MNIERIKYCQEQTAIIRTYSDDYYKELDDILIEAWNEGYTIPDIAKAFGWKERSVQTRLTLHKIDWRNCVLPQAPTEEPFVYTV